MTPILISSVFGLTSFSVIVAVCIKALKPVHLPATQQNMPEFTPALMPVPVAPLKIEGGEQFLPIEATWELKFPKVAFRRDTLRSLPLGAPLRRRFRPLS